MNVTVQLYRTVVRVLWNRLEPWLALVLALVLAAHSGQARASGPDGDCDGFDDDADGQTDEGYVGMPTSCGVGACASTGVIVCAPVFVSADILPSANVPPGETFRLVSSAGVGPDAGATLGLRADGTAVGWNRNGDGQATPPSGVFTDLAAGQYHSLGLRPDGSVVGFGYSPQGQTVPQAGPFQAIAVGEYWSVGLKTDGSIQLWGGYNKPPDFPAGSYLAVDAGADFAIAIRADGSLAAVDAGFYGDSQLAVPAGNDFVAIDAGFHHALALRADGTAVGWGRNDFGQASPPSGVFLEVQAGSFHSWGAQARRHDRQVGQRDRRRGAGGGAVQDDRRGRDRRARGHQHL